MADSIQRSTARAVRYGTARVTSDKLLLGNFSGVDAPDPHQTGRLSENVNFLAIALLSRGRP